jgi:Protein of unknown function (DUF998)
MLRQYVRPRQGTFDVVDDVGVTTPARTTLRRLVLGRPNVVAFATAAAVLNCSFVLESLLPGPARVGATVVSDLSVPGTPWSWVFRAADAGSALCLLVVCIALASRRAADEHDGAQVSHGAWVVGWIATTVYAASTLLAAIIAETCAPAVEPSCPDGPAVASLTDIVHDTISSVGSSSGVLACLAFAVALRRTTWLWALHGTAFVVAALSGLCFVALQAGAQDDLSGWVQRVQIVALSAWFVVLGMTADRRRGPPRVAGTTGHERMRP